MRDFFLEPLNDVNLMHIKGRNSRVCWCMSVIPGLRGVQQKEQEPEASRCYTEKEKGLGKKTEEKARRSKQSPRRRVFRYLGSRAALRNADSDRGRF